MRLCWAVRMVPTFALWADSISLIVSSIRLCLCTYRVYYILVTALTIRFQPHTESSRHFQYRRASFMFMCLGWKVRTSWNVKMMKTDTCTSVMINWIRPLLVKHGGEARITGPISKGPCRTPLEGSTFQWYLTTKLIKLFFCNRITA